MGIYDRPYWKDGGQPGGGPGRSGMGGFTIGLPKPGPVIKWLLIVNLVVFLLQLFLDRPTTQYPAGVMSQFLGITLGESWQLWRYITFQFLHGDFWHIVLNMIGLYFLGTALERSWGPKRFLRFYLVCGVAAGLAFVVVSALFRQPDWRPLIGASGGVYGVVLACAVLFPQFRIIFLFFPVPIRLAAVIIFGGMIILVLQAVSYDQIGKAMSDVAHLGGAVTAAVWVWVLPKLRGSSRRARVRIEQGAWRRKMKKRDAEETEMDRILQKINTEGLGSLTAREKKILQEATRRQRQEEHDVNRL